MTAHLINIDPEMVEIGQRFRKELGDLDGLAASILSVGLLHPIVVDADHNLIVGERRLRAWMQAKPGELIPAYVVSDIDVMNAESDENNVRKAFTPIEGVAIRDALMEREKAKAAAEQEAGRERGRKVQRGESVSPKFGETDRHEREAKRRASKAAGFSDTTLDKVAAVVKAAEDPEMPEPVRKVAKAQVSALSKHNAKVDSAYRETEKAKDVAFDRKRNEMKAGSPEVRQANTHAAVSKVASAIATFLVFEPEFVALYASEEDMSALLFESERLAKFVAEVQSKRRLRVVG